MVGRDEGRSPGEAVAWAALDVSREPHISWNGTECRVKEWERGRERERVIRVARETDRRRHGLP